MGYEQMWCKLKSDLELTRNELKKQKKETETELIESVLKAMDASEMLEEARVKNYM